MSAGAFLSPSWYRVAGLRPQLGDPAQIQRQRYRGVLWYLITDRRSGRVHRFSPAAYLLLSRMDGRRTVAQIWQEVVQALGEEAPGQDEVIQLLGQLHASDLLQCDVMPDTAELFDRFGKQARGTWQRNLLNPLAIRLPLWDPDAFLKRTLPWVQPLLSRFGFLLWLAVVLTGIVLAAAHWQELTENFSDRVLALHNLVILWLTFPVLKALHELGHAYATRAGGGEVHELGIMLLVLMPIPYVDATATAGFRRRWRRVFVGAAGMMVEVFLASLALFLWLLVEPGAWRAVLFNVMLIAGVSTLLFNGNPLLRYDGYYMLSDLLEIPNLAQRANRYWAYLAERYLFAVRELEPFEATGGERRWFLFYAPLSFVYRILVMVGIALFLASTFFVVGVVMALWSGVTLLLLPLGKALHYLFASPRLASRRRRALLVSGALTALVLTGVGLLPLPLRTQSEGVVWLPKQAEVRAGTSGFIRRVLVKPGTPVAADEPLVECEEPVLAAEIALHRARVAELETRRAAEWVTDRVKAEITRQELEQEQANLVRAEERAGQLIIRSGTRGRFVLAQEPADLPGRFVKQGDLIGYVVDGAADRVRVVVTQDNIDLVRRHTRAVAVRFADRLDVVLPATLIREVPAAKTQLPSPALSTQGGGQQALDPRDPQGNTALERIFEFDLALASPLAGATAPAYGSRVYVRFEHQPEPLVSQWWRRLRQLFLSRLNV
jgi:putative peptide zinc metalloprotease protein